LVPAGRDNSIRRSFLQGTLLEICKLKRLFFNEITRFKGVESSGGGEYGRDGGGSEESCESERAHGWSVGGLLIGRRG